MGFMRLATLDDVPTIRKALAAFKARVSPDSFIGVIDLDKAMLGLAAEIQEGNGYIVQDFLVMVDVLTPWYSHDKVLREWFTLKLRFRASGHPALAPSLVAIGQQRGCSLVITGDTSNSLARWWLAGEMYPLTQSFFKKV